MGMELGFPSQAQQTSPSRQVSKRAYRHKQDTATMMLGLSGNLWARQGLR